MQGFILTANTAAKKLTFISRLDVVKDCQFGVSPVNYSETGPRFQSLIRKTGEAQDQTHDPWFTRRVA